MINFLISFTIMNVISLFLSFNKAKAFYVGVVNGTVIKEGYKSLSSNINEIDCEKMSLIQLEILTDENPEEISWILYKLPNFENQRSGSGYKEAFTLSSTRLCLDDGIYEFKIFDTMGNGLGEGDGGYYKLMVKDKMIKQKFGYFGFSEDSQFTICSSDSECEDNDPCSYNFCDLETKLCLKEKLKCSSCLEDYSDCMQFEECIPSECSECGKVEVQMDLMTDNDQSWMNWEIKKIKENKIEMSGSGYSGYNDIYQIFKKSRCFDVGEYHFIIEFQNRYTSDGGYYKLSVKNEIIAELEGPNFHSENQETEFLICFSDIDCNDDDDCTTDFCDIYNNLCRNEKLPCKSCLPDNIIDTCNQSYTSCIPSDCSECGKLNFYLEVKTDTNPTYTSWEVSLLQTNEKVLSSDNFESYDDVYKVYENRICLEDNNYAFTFNDIDGLYEGGYYKLKINNETIKEVHGPNLNFLAQETVFCSSRCESFGNPTALVIKVHSQDSESPAYFDEIRKNIFGTEGNDFSVKSQFSACSYNKFNINPFSGTTSSGLFIANGIFDLNMTRNIDGEQASFVTSEILALADRELGDMEDKFDFVIVCIPPGTKIGLAQNWRAFAYINSYLSIYNGENCNYASVIMHEIGHNIGLSHSHDEKNYGDETGMMGLSYDNEKSLKCFNAPKSWQLGWYHNSHYIIDLETLFSGSNHHYSHYQLVGIADLDANVINRYFSILKIINAGDGNDYYVSFNSNKNMNAGTKEGVNQVLVTKQENGYSYQDSFLIARLQHNMRHKVIMNLESKDDFEISTTIFLRHYPPSASVYLTNNVERNCLNDSQCNDFDSCTVDTCKNFKCTYSRLLCSECGAMVNVKLSINEYPEYITWMIRDLVTERTALSSSYYGPSNTLYHGVQCIQSGKYIYSISNGKNLTHLESPISFYLSVNDEVIDSGTISQEDHIESFFIICSSDENCFDFDGCTSDICNTETKLCENVRLDDEEDCLNCSWLTLSITTDNYPDEIVWSLYNNDKTDKIFTGNPFPFDINNAYGRRSKPTRAGRRSKPTRSSRISIPSRIAGNRRKLDLVNSMLDGDESETISKTICLENNIYYHFIIIDTFGDGICCAEGNGSYAIFTNDVEIIKGGNFSDYEKFSFEFKTCITDDDCIDGNSCSYDFCRKDISTCIYITKPCEQCGMYVVVSIITDENPLETTWSISDAKRELLAGGPYSSSYTSYEKQECLPQGSYLFSIFDSWDGLKLCNQNIYGINCGYKLTVGNETIKSGADFYVSEVTSFEIAHPCNLNNECDDENSCTRNVCSKDSNTCNFNELSCSDCEKIEVKLSINIEWTPNNFEWNIVQHGTDITIDRGSGVDKQKIYEYNNCLSGGSYEVFIRGLKNVQGSYFLRVGGQTIEEEEHGNIDYDDIRMTFEILNVSSVHASMKKTYIPSILPTPNTSHNHKSSFPSYVEHSVSPSTSSDKILTTSPSIKKLELPSVNPFGLSTNTNESYQPTLITLVSEMPSYQSTEELETSTFQSKVHSISPSYTLYPSSKQSQIVETRKPSQFSSFHSQFNILSSGPSKSIQIAKSKSYSVSPTAKSESGYTIFPSTERKDESIQPSFSSNKSTTAKPSESFRKMDNWFIEFDKAYTEKQVLEGITFEYWLSQEIDQEQLDVRLLDESCLQNVGNELISIENITTIYSKVEGNAKAKITLLFDFNEISRSFIWRDISSSVGFMSFCVQTHLVSNDISVSFAETLFNLSVDFSADFPISDLALHTHNVTRANRSAGFSISACICHNTIDHKCVDHPKITQNSFFTICIWPMESTALISDIKKLSFVQDGVTKYTPVKNSIKDSLTELNVGKIASITTRMISSFFHDKSPSPVHVEGEIKLKFRSQNRFLKERTRENNVVLKQDVNFGFIIEVLIEN